MIRGIGIDTIEIARFAHWHNYNAKQLHRIFSPEEVSYCLQLPKLSSERFAARFAIREAFFKAVSAAFPDVKFPFFTVCRAIATVHNSSGVPQIKVKWDLILTKKENLRVHLTLTHTHSVATAFIIIEE